MHILKITLNFLRARGLFWTPMFCSPPSFSSFIMLPYATGPYDANVELVSEGGGGVYKGTSITTEQFKQE